MTDLPPCSPSLAAKQTRILLGCYRKGEATDPEVYVSSVATVLTRYPETVVRKVTHPVDGIPGKLNWLPTVAEVRSACEAEMKPFYDQIAREKRQGDQALLMDPQSVASPEERERAVSHYENSLRPELMAHRDTDKPQRPKETPEQAMARLEALKDTPVVIGGELRAKLNAMARRREAAE